MRRLLIFPLIVVLAVVCLFAAAGLALKWLAGDAGKDRFAASLSQAAGVPVTIAAADFDLAQWFRFQPALSLEGVTIGNPPGFRGKNLLEARRMAARVALWPLVRRNVQVHSIEIEQPRFVIEKNARGETNIETFLKGLSAAKPGATAPEAQTSGGTAVAIDKITITSGEIVLSDGMRVRDIDLGVQDFSAGRSSRFQLSARLFGGQTSNVRLEGSAGPLSATALPVDGKLALAIAPAEIPAAFRNKVFGDVLSAPGRESRATLDASIRGDVYGAVSGPATVRFSSLMVGKDPGRLLALAGDAPIQVSASRLMSAPAFELRMAKGTLRLGKGQWTGAAEVRVRGQMVTGSSKGAIRNIDINELVSSFTTARGKIFGALSMPSYQLKFAGRNADEIQRSLDGGGKLSIAEGRVAAMDLLTSIQRALERRQEDTAAKGATPFTTLSADLNVGGSRLDLSGVLLESPALRLTGKGAIGFDHSMNLDLDARVIGGLSQTINRLIRREAADEATLPLSVTGTVESPRVRPKIGKVATGVATGLIESFFKKRQQQKPQQ